MGNPFSRPKESTLEVLEGLAKSIAHLEDRHKEVELRERRLITSFLFWAALAYVASLAFAFVSLRPSEPGEWALLALPVLALPSLIWLAKTSLSWFYRRQLAANEDALQEAQAKRRKILEGVKETETYKVAQDILERFDPATREERAAKERERERRKEEEILRRASPQGLRRRPAPSDPAPSPAPGGPRTPGPQRPSSRQGHMEPPHQPFTPGPRMAMTPGPGGMPPQTPRFPATPGPALMAPRLPRPVLPAERGKLDKLVDYLLGDGPSNRYALICSECRSHNGMALSEEFPFLAFRCAFCAFFNPARQRRPNAPRLPSAPPSKAPSTLSLGPTPAQSRQDLAKGSGSEDTASEASRPSSKSSSPVPPETESQTSLGSKPSQDSQTSEGSAKTQEE